jgi:hypothetical protein
MPAAVIHEPTIGLCMDSLMAWTQIVGRNAQQPASSSMSSTS